jgi:predicted DNA-binding transcriptional regulator YafY
MSSSFEKYIGWTLEIVYIDRKRNITQRKVKIWSVHGDQVKGYCFSKKCPHLFRLENILAVRPIKGRGIA